MGGAIDGAEYKSFRGLRESQRQTVAPQRELARQRQRLESRESPCRQKLTSFSRQYFHDAGVFFSR